MKPLYTSAQVRAIEQQAIASGISAYALMQRAASAALRAIGQRWPDARRLLVVCGSGNNAGDGYELASQAHEAGWQIQLFYLTAPAQLRDAALIAANAALAAGLSCQPFSAGLLAQSLSCDGGRPAVLVDALLGIGFKAPLRPVFREAIQAINACNVPVFAIDVPSGLNADTGCIDSVAVRADATLCVVARKQGLLTGDAPACTGELLVDDLGIDIPLASVQHPASVRGIDADLLQQRNLARSPTSHKGDSGHVLIAGGDHGTAGAGIMAAQAAARAGAGTTALITRPAHILAMLARCPEIMAHGMDDNGQLEAGKSVADLMSRAAAIVAGPGLGQSDWSNRLLDAVLLCADRFHVPLVLDADALNLLATRNTPWHELASESDRAQWIITPHPGEAARLLGWSPQQVSADRFAAVRALQHKTGTVCLLKGAGSLLAFPDQRSPLDLCMTGNPGMASGGMGDVLAGIAGAMLALGNSLASRQPARGFDASEAARLAVCVHGVAADQAAAALGQRGLLATDLLLKLPALLSGWSDRRL